MRNVFAFISCMVVNKEGVKMDVIPIGVDVAITHVQTADLFVKYPWE